MILNILACSSLLGHDICLDVYVVMVASQNHVIQALYKSCIFILRNLAPFNTKWMENCS